MEGFDGMSPRTSSPAFIHQDDLKRDRFWRGGRVKFMTEAKGYVMARKPGAAPFVIALKEWLSLPFVG